MKKITILLCLASILLFTISCQKDEDPMVGPDPIESNDPPSITLRIVSNATIQSQENDNYIIEVPRGQDLSLEFSVKTPAGLASATLGGDPVGDRAQSTLTAGGKAGLVNVTYIYLSGDLPPEVLEVTDKNGKKASVSITVTLPLGFDVNTIFPGVWRATNFQPADPNGFVSQVFGTKDGSLLIINDDKVYRSTDQGVSWSKANINVTGWLGSMAQHPDGMIYLTGYEKGKIYTSSDDGQNWSILNTNLPELSGISVVYVSADKTIYINGFFNAQNSTVDGIYKSTDGVSWERIMNMPLVEGIYTVGDSEIYAYTIYPGKLFKTVDGGASWNEIAVPSSEFITTFGKVGNDLLMGTDKNFFKSSDNGDNWAPFNQGIPDKEFVKNLFVTANGSVLITPINYGVFRLDDNGTWRSIGTSIGTVNIKSITQAQGLIYVSGQANQKIYKLN